MALFPKPSLQRYLSVPNQHVHLPLWISLVFWLHVLPADSLAWGEICTDPLGNVLSLQSNRVWSDVLSDISSLEMNRISSCDTASVG